jgi:hypothetical protein
MGIGRIDGTNIAEVPRLRALRFDQDDSFALGCE